MAAKWEVMKFILVVMLLAAPSVAQTLTYCVNESVLAVNETFQVCGPSPVLNPSSVHCANYSTHREELCAAGCDPANASCAPLPFDRALIIVAIIVFIILIAWAARRSG
jgi:hypothetical protein